MPFSANNDVWRFKSTRSAFESRLYIFSCFSLIFDFIYGDSLSLFFSISITNFFLFYLFRSYSFFPSFQLLYVLSFWWTFIPFHFFYYFHFSSLRLHCLYFSFFYRFYILFFTIVAFLFFFISFHHHYFISKSFLIIYVHIGLFV